MNNGQKYLKLINNHYAKEASSVLGPANSGGWGDHKGKKGKATRDMAKEKRPGQSTITREGKRKAGQEPSYMRTETPETSSFMDTTPVG